MDKFLIDRLDNTRLVLHRPQEMPGIQGPSGDYITVIKDGDRYRAYYRDLADKNKVGGDGSSNDRICYCESHDGIIWEKPQLDLFPDDCKSIGNAVLKEPPYCAAFSPFLDSRQGIPADARFKALAGWFCGIEASGNGPGLYAFASPDGIHWRRTSERAVIPYNPELHGPNAFDSQNVAFWSETEKRYVACFRHMKTPEGVLRTVSRATSEDFVNWRDESAGFTCPNLPGEDLYTNQTHPYFRAPHIYIALPTRFTQGLLMGNPVEGDRWGAGNKGSADIMFMTMRAGANAYQRTFKEAFLRPGLNAERWGSRANYVALNVVPTGPAEMSIYHKDGTRCVLRTDGFASVNAPWLGGRLTV